jgi:hypothetical protein
MVSKVDRKNAVLGTWTWIQSSINTFFGFERTSGFEYYFVNAKSVAFPTIAQSQPIPQTSVLTACIAAIRRKSQSIGR